MTLNLNGTQNIENGVYLFTCVKNNQSSQTFIGAGSAQQDVDLSVDFSFNVDDPTVKLSSSSSEGENSETHWTGKYYTVTLPGVGEDVGSGRNEDIPKTGRQPAAYPSDPCSRYHGERMSQRRGYRALPQRA